MALAQAATSVGREMASDVSGVWGISGVSCIPWSWLFASRLACCGASAVSLSRRVSSETEQPVAKTVRTKARIMHRALLRCFFVKNRIRAFTGRPARLRPGFLHGSCAKIVLAYTSRAGISSFAATVSSQANSASRLAQTAAIQTSGFHQ